MRVCSYSIAENQYAALLIAHPRAASGAVIILVLLVVLDLTAAPNVSLEK